MRIKSIFIDGFGIWHESRLEPDAGLTVVSGDNEAGKTTLLAFIRAILFGFETNQYPAVAGGRRGGWLDVVTADERAFRIERYGDRGGQGAVHVTGEDGVDRGAEYLSRLLHGVEA
ncbi:MAG: ATP-binding protein, partial [Candidatus Limnocylindria bacterium]